MDREIFTVYLCTECTNLRVRIEVYLKFLILVQSQFYRRYSIFLSIERFQSATNHRPLSYIAESHKTLIFDTPCTKCIRADVPGTPNILGDPMFYSTQRIWYEWRARV